MSDIRALPSYWRGNVFRSRTEARWAVFWTTMDVRWEYEPEGYALADDTWHLPDFWLPDIGCYAEVKPDTGPTEEERAKAHALVMETGHPLLFLSGAPWPQRYQILHRETSGGETRVVTYDVCWDASMGRCRLYYTPGESDLAGRGGVRGAMAFARRLSLREPEAADLLPAGWDGFEVAEGDDEDWLDLSGDALEGGDAA